MTLQRSRFVSVAALLFAFAGAAVARPLPQESRAVVAAGIPWRTDLKAAMAEARTTRRPLCIVFRCEA